ncbi:hypothetical protein [Sabulicella glaciei]|uniref:Uncharacterized protein n=1 Tax=Sabulicella glaciei TaxID=2984948 RepID=A0ABT3NZP4_9PROT|nr:hypothetical protein [Roseococcus sp. MDT2-1-1]MCW8087601.1 hypothetical protein [Roseococcus sp. MDT2-1-1]
MRRVGRFVVLVDRQGIRHALSATAVVAICETEDGSTILLLPGGRHIVTEIALDELAMALSTPAYLAPREGNV